MKKNKVKRLIILLVVVSLVIAIPVIADEIQTVKWSTQEKRFARSVYADTDWAAIPELGLPSFGNEAQVNISDTVHYLYQQYFDKIGSRLSSLPAPIGGAYRDYKELVFAMMTKLTEKAGNDLAKACEYVDLEDTKPESLMFELMKRLLRQEAVYANAFGADKVNGPYCTDDALRSMVQGVLYQLYPKFYTSVTPENLQGYKTKAQEYNLRYKEYDSFADDVFSIYSAIQAATERTETDGTDDTDLVAIPAGTVVTNPSDAYFSINEIPSDIFATMQDKSFNPNQNDIARGELRYLKVIYYDYKGTARVGDLIVNKSIAEDTLAALKECFNKKIQIHSMYLIDQYYVDNGNDADTNSIIANNTSAFNYRTVSDGDDLSKHALGMAIDINPYENPYVYTDGNKIDTSDGAIVYSDEVYEGYADPDKREEATDPHVFTAESEIVKIFKKHGFTWGGDWAAQGLDHWDYQHFEHT